MGADEQNLAKIAAEGVAKGDKMKLAVETATEKQANLRTERLGAAVAECLVETLIGDGKRPGALQTEPMVIAAFGRAAGPGASVLNASSVQKLCRDHGIAISGEEQRLTDAATLTPGRVPSADGGTSWDGTGGGAAVADDDASGSSRDRRGGRGSAASRRGSVGAGKSGEGGGDSGEKPLDDLAVLMVLRVLTGKRAG